MKLLCHVGKSDCGLILIAVEFITVHLNLYGYGLAYEELEDIVALQ
jgi:hypothetical protein